MTRTELVKAVSEITGDSQKKTKEVLEAVQTVVFDVMKREEEVKVFDGVTLVGVHKDATVARNPLTGGSVDVPEKTVPKAKFGAGLKRMLAE